MDEQDDLKKGANELIHVPAYIPQPNTVSSPLSHEEAGTAIGTQDGKTVVDGLPENGEEDRALLLKKRVEFLKSEHTKLTGSLEQEVVSVKSLEEALTPLVQSERALAGVIKEAEMNEQLAGDSSLRRKYEEERWKHSEERVLLERKKWQVEEELEKHKTRVEDLRKTLSATDEEEKTLEDELQTLELEGEKKEVDSELESLLRKRLDTESKLKTLKNSREEVITELGSLNKAENEIEHKEEDVEGKVSLAVSRQEEHSFEEERYELDRKRHELETKRWQIEDKMSSLESSVADMEKFLKELKDKEDELRIKSESLEIKKYNLTAK